MNHLKNLKFSRKKFISPNNKALLLEHARCIKFKNRYREIKNILNKLKKISDGKETLLNKIMSAAINTTPAMTGRKKGLLGCLKN